MKLFNRLFPDWWLTLIIYVFVLMILASLIMAGVSLMLLKLELFTLGEPNFIAGVIAFTITSILLGTIMTAIVGKRLMSPIILLTKATKEIAKGNFDVSVPEYPVPINFDHLIQDFNKMALELKGIEMLRTDFIANVSHEFKTPIASIKGYATLLQDENISTEERHEYTQMIIDSTNQLSKLSSNILSLSKLENQEIVMDKAPFQLDEQIRQAFLMLEPQWSQKNIRVYPELSPVIYCGNADLMMQIWLNIIGNAIKFTNEFGSIFAELYVQNNDIYIIFSDTGVGMSPEVQEHIFEKFYQGNHNRSTEGNGLGLSLVKRIVDLCYGTIDVQSKPNIGTTFTIILPFKE
ncbi:sensor signal transduction histidine kinase [Gottschalkia acidurici 9a]|uniref:histidine kinase n=1 Tax=Gottschalkia acidurici (strain ATCC 7906 / DSM 604 / BCRC 14475 / CIP 104303 / KCTC 5404 / NCIMB 10678 / 9a) TaxID=1128398 RepID=K0AXZ4_GOTA9|nr:HAMP domain-containing sensor histidine kinase [Gottschalkia acidurici]AFS77620.1 sensor signal transduction histidine kinase [Gottschalkia acidurici 9a]